jgi:hypothetical protein|tara:strand:+ start:309 stop:584 length:276 start_codon:yes stop_codon:yes gene_type:complete
VEQDLNEWADSIEQVEEFISILEKEEVVTVFFELPELPMLEEAKAEPLSRDNRTIMYNALVNKKTVDEKSKKFRVTLQFFEIDNIVRDIIC